ncbi:hypothetical protein N0B51_06490 [Tsuneonella sp. YG55]|uniref:Uncharacterized protein n=1 Tax=Tsuneonella litorea TaxID=2976475 RepID=A0A9X2W1N6_9SPHN|nr:hypothetical protein [Tsuneonella litorea]MCT2558624.1 hypothetical protein [Tsuneonella litorea]
MTTMFTPRLKMFCRAVGALLLALVALHSGAVLAQPTVDAVSTNSVNSSTVTFTHTVGSSSSRLILVTVAIAEKDADVSTVTYAGQPLTLIALTRGKGGDGAIEVWGRVAPAMGTNNVVVTLTKSRPSVIGVTSFFGVNQSAPWGTPATLLGDHFVPSISLAGSATQLIFGGIVTNGDTTYATADPGQTALWSIANGTGGAGLIGAGSTKAGAATNTLTWNLSQKDAWGIVAVPINSGGSPTISATLTSAPLNDPIRGTVNPLDIPGAVVTHSTTVQNSGTGAPDSNTVDVILAVPASTKLSVADIGGGSSGPVQFTNGTPPSSLTYTFTSLSSTTDDLEFSSDNGATWTYTPVADAQQLDGNVTRMRVRLKGAFAAAPSGTPTSFTLSYRTKID